MVIQLNFYKHLIIDIFFVLILTNHLYLIQVHLILSINHIKYTLYISLYNGGIITLPPGKGIITSFNDNSSNIIILYVLLNNHHLQ